MESSSCRRPVQAVWLCGLVWSGLLLILVSTHGSSAGSVTCLIDTHCHFYPPFYLDILRAKNLTQGGAATPPWSVQAHLQMNKLTGIDTSVISVTTPGAKLSPSDPLDDGRKLARQLNEYGHMLSQTYPGKFKFFATLTLPDVEGAVAEAIYALDTLKAAGVILLANTFGLLLGSPDEDPLFEVLNERNAAVFVHPSSSPCVSEAAISLEGPQLPSAVVDFLLDTSRVAANLVLQNVTRRFPNVKWLLSHSGGFIPFAAFRMAVFLGNLTNTTPMSNLQQLQGLYVDVARSATPTALPSTLVFLPTTHLTFGTDYPFVPLSLDAVAELENYPTLSHTELMDISYQTATTILKI